MQINNSSPTNPSLTFPYVRKDRVSSYDDRAAFAQSYCGIAYAKTEATNLEGVTKVTIAGKVYGITVRFQESSNAIIEFPPSSSYSNGFSQDSGYRLKEDAIRFLRNTVLYDIPTAHYFLQCEYDSEIGCRSPDWAKKNPVWLRRANIVAPEGQLFALESSAPPDHPKRLIGLINKVWYDVKIETENLIYTRSKEQTLHEIFDKTIRSTFPSHFPNIENIHVLEVHTNIQRTRLYRVSDGANIDYLRYDGLKLLEQTENLSFEQTVRQLRNIWHYKHRSPFLVTKSEMLRGQEDRTFVRTYPVFIRPLSLDNPAVQVFKEYYRADNRSEGPAEYARNILIYRQQGGVFLKTKDGEECLSNGSITTYIKHVQRHNALHQLEYESDEESVKEKEKKTFDRIESLKNEMNSLNAAAKQEKDECSNSLRNAESTPLQKESKAESEPQITFTEEELARIIAQFDLETKKAAVERDLSERQRLATIFNDSARIGSYSS